MPLTQASNPAAAIRFVMQLRAMKLLAALSRVCSLEESSNRCAAGSSLSEPTLEATLTEMSNFRLHPISRKHGPLLGPCF
jgi:hypothetical protein